MFTEDILNFSKNIFDSKVVIILMCEKFSKFKNKLLMNLCLLFHSNRLAGEWVLLLVPGGIFVKTWVPLCLVAKQ